MKLFLLVGCLALVSVAPAVKPSATRLSTSIPSTKATRIPVRMSLNDSIIAYYPFENGGRDETGHEHDGNLFGSAEIVPDERSCGGSMLALDGNGGVMVTAGKPLVPTSTLSISFDVKLRSQSDRQIFVSSINFYTGTGFGYFVGINRPQDRRLVFGTASSGADCGVQYRAPADHAIGPLLETGKWYSITTRFHQGVAELFIDGELAAEGKTSFQQINSCSNANFIIGNWWRGDAIGLDGFIDNVKVYDRLVEPSRPTISSGLAL